MARIEIAGLTKSYVGRNAARAVDAIDLSIADGEVMALVGPSGCGKTTTLQLLAGFLKPDAGTIAVGERVVSSPKHVVPPEKRRMSLIFQSYAVWPHMTVFENVAYGLHVMKLSRSEIEDRTTKVLQTVRMTDLAQRYPSELSGGQQQRVALARALVVEPETLLLDEPLSNLDANLREEMRFEVRRLHDEYRYTTVYVTHDQSEAMTTADLICVMNAGKIEQAGAPEDIYYRPQSEFVARFIGASNVLRGRSLGGGRIEIGGVPVACTGEPPAAGLEAPVSVRQHDIALLTAPPASTENVVPATVLRQVFLGGTRDYMVELPGGAQLRVLTQADTSVPPGSAVWLHLPPDRCRALAR